MTESTCIETTANLENPAIDISSSVLDQTSFFFGQVLYFTCIYENVNDKLELYRLTN